ncbi:hypothetical protein OG791_48380 [Streptomyces canus]
MPVGDQADGEPEERLADVVAFPADTQPHRKRPHRPLLPGEEEDNAAHRKVRARVEHVIGRMKNYKILRDCRQRGDGLHNAVQAVAHMHNLALAS